MYINADTRSSLVELDRDPGLRACKSGIWPEKDEFCNYYLQQLII